MSDAYVKPGVTSNYVRHLRSRNVEDLQDELNVGASQGHRYVKLKPLFTVSQGGYWSHGKGTYANSFVLIMEPCEPGLLYRVSLLKRDRHATSGTVGDMDGALQSLAEVQAWAGYTLIDTVTIDSFGIEKPGPGTTRLICIFERRLGSSLTLDVGSLKSQRQADHQEVECPVLGCPVMVPRMRGDGDNLDKSNDTLGPYMCPNHRIFISPSTFEYVNPSQSILWHDETDIEDVKVLRTLSGGKHNWRRMGRECDEDSLTWNVFRALDVEGVLPEILHELVPPYSGTQPNHRHNLIFWSVDLQNREVWEPLRRARVDLGEVVKSEPDLIVVREHDILLFEVKFNSPAKTRAPKFPNFYAEQPRWGKVFGNVNPPDVLDAWGYELTRYHLLAAAIGEDLGRMCTVVSLVRDGEKERLIRAANTIPIHTHRGEPFRVISWSELDKSIKVGSPRLQALKGYLKGKTSGYNASGILTKLLN